MTTTKMTSLDRVTALAEAEGWTAQRKAVMVAVKDYDNPQRYDNGTIKYDRFDRQVPTTKSVPGVQLTLSHSLAAEVRVAFTETGKYVAEQTRSLSWYDRRFSAEEQDKFGDGLRAGASLTEVLKHLSAFGVARCERLIAEREERDAKVAEREAEEQKRREINNAVNAAVERLKERHREEFETLVTIEYRNRKVTPSDLDAADVYYNRAVTVRPEGWSSAVNA